MVAVKCFGHIVTVCHLFPSLVLFVPCRRGQLFSFCHKNTLLNFGYAVASPGKEWYNVVGNHIIGSLIGATEAAFCVGSTEGGLFLFSIFVFDFLFRLIF